MDYNEHKYWAEGSDLTEVEKIQMAKDLRELESRGVFMLPVSAKVPVTGSYNSALASAVLPPPTTSTSPSFNSVAV